ncbi:RNA polymerase sigma-70 factor (ECF subfamily) [Catenulispora sp. EB89]|uniref:RNA polymerase sigma factor n=1 Tax=Catenulispora sp. EB89 TaxID=3156257 RepID=UPI0035121D9D
MPRDPAQDPHKRFTHVYQQHYEHVARYASRRVPPDDVADVVATTFLTAWRRFDQLPEEPLPWLYGTARRVIANDRRGRARWEALIAKSAEQAVIADPDLADQVCSVLQVADALTLLSEADRELILLTEWERLSVTEAAVVVGCSATTARVRLHRARRRLARHLSEAPVEPLLQPAAYLEPDLTKGAGGR